MRRRADPLTVAVALLAGACAVEVVLMLPFAQRPEPPASAAPVPPASPVAAPRPDRDLGPILARPLFSQSRRPVPVAPRTAAAEAGARLPRLSGIVVTSEGQLALFAPEGAGRPLALHEGDSLGPLVIRSIGSDGVVADGASGPTTLRPTWEDRPPPTSAAPPPIANPPDPHERGVNPSRRE
jgi:hypothetical protein